MVDVKAKGELLSLPLLVTRGLHTDVCRTGTARLVAERVGLAGGPSTAPQGVPPFGGVACSVINLSLNSLDEASGTPRAPCESVSVPLIASITPRVHRTDLFRELNARDRGRAAAGGRLARGVGSREAATSSRTPADRFRRPASAPHRTRHRSERSRISPPAPGPRPGSGCVRRPPSV